MRSIVRAGLMITVLYAVLACATPTTTWTSRPQAAKASTAEWVAQIRPVKLDKPFFVAFELTLANTASAPLEIDWNRTYYTHDRKNSGLLVFKGIQPEDVKNRTLPNEIIPAGGRLTKIVSPARTIAWSKLSSNAPKSQPAFEPGILPQGNNGVALFLIQQARQWTQPLAVEIIAEPRRD